MVFFVFTGYGTSYLGHLHPRYLHHGDITGHLNWPRKHEIAIEEGAY